MVSRTKSSGFPCKTLLFLIITITSGLIYYDVSKHGSWCNSTTHKTLNHTGVYNYTDRALLHAREGSVWIHDHIEEQFPGITKATIKYTEPYIELGVNLGKVVSNIAFDVKKAAVAKIPIVLEKIEHYAPGLIEKSTVFVQNTWATTCLYIHNGMDYIQTEILVGTLEPQNIQRIVSETVNQVHDKAFECYRWVYNKIESAIK